MRTLHIGPAWNDETPGPAPPVYSIYLKPIQMSPNVRKVVMDKPALSPYAPAARRPASAYASCRCRSAGLLAICAPVSPRHGRRRQRAVTTSCPFFRLSAFTVSSSSTVVCAMPYTVAASWAIVSPSASGSASTNGLPFFLGPDLRPVRRADHHGLFVDTNFSRSICGSRHNRPACPARTCTHWKISCAHGAGPWRPSAYGTELIGKLLPFLLRVNAQGSRNLGK